jgi:hypothetical protein
MEGMERVMLATLDGNIMTLQVLEVNIIIMNKCCRFRVLCPVLWISFTLR